MKITYDNLFKASFTILTKLGADEHEARQVSESLVRANMRTNTCQVWRMALS